MTLVMVSPSARAEKVRAMRCLSTGSARAITSRDGGRDAALDQGAGADRQHQRLAGARARAPEQLVGDAGIASLPGRAERTRSRIASTTLSPTGSRRTRRCAFMRRLGVHHRHGPVLVDAGGLDEDAALGLAVRIADVDLQQEAVELRLGQGIGALLLDRVLGRQHVEGLRQVVPLAADRNVMLLHGLEQGRLGARAGAVDLVRHQELGEDRPLDEPERAPAVGALVEDLGAEDVGRHQVRRELDAAGIEPEHDAQGLDELGLGEAGHADEQAVAARRGG